MKTKRFNFDFPRGNTCPITFDLVDNQQEPFELAEGDEIYFTIKKVYTMKKFLLQKKLSDGDITIEDNVATIMLNEEDTANLDFGKYDYDIKFKNQEENYAKTLVVGDVELTEETTWLANE